MRSPNRNVEVFSISALDLFASALGAFIIVAIILFPYYLKSQEVRAEVDNRKSELEAAKTELEEAQSALENATSSLEEKATELEGVQSQLTAAKIELSKTFLVVGIDWATSGA